MNDLLCDQEILQRFDDDFADASVFSNGFFLGSVPQFVCHTNIAQGSICHSLDHKCQVRNNFDLSQIKSTEVLYTIGIKLNNYFRKLRVHATKCKHNAFFSSLQMGNSDVVSSFNNSVHFSSFPSAPELVSVGTVNTTVGTESSTEMGQNE